MIRQLLILILFLPITSFSQSEKLLDNNKFSLSLNTGLNLSKFRNDSMTFNSGAKPFIGTSFSYLISQRLDIKGTTGYSIKSSSAIRPNKVIENQYFDFTFSPRFKISTDLYFHAGLSYSYLLKSNEIINNGDNWNGIERIEINGYSSEINTVAGIEFKLHDNVNINLNYTIPTNKHNTSNFQIGLNFTLNNRIEKEPSYRRKKTEASKNQIKQLKTSVLLVRLKTSENTINALIKAGQIEKANKLKLKQEAENKKIVNAFNKNFDFCEVRYFFSSNSDKVRQKLYNGIFLNDSLEVDNSIKLDTSITFLIAEFGYIEKDTMKMFSHYSYEPSKNGGMEKVANYYSTSSDIDFYALRILDSNFVQLNKPFPFYTRAIYKTMRMHPEQFLFVSPIYLVFLTWSYDETVLRMNRKLERYYEKSK